MPGAKHYSMPNNKFDIALYCQRMENHLGGQEGPAKPFWKALAFAVDAHSGQRRKSGEAYVSHPCEVARILVEEFGVEDPQTLAAAILHDTVEDVDEVDNELIGEIFGRDVEAIVDGCTKIAHFKGNRQTFYKLVHRKLFSGAAARVEIMLIKLADRLHNLRTMGSMPKHKRQKIADETLAVYAPMAKVMGLFELKRELYNLALVNKFPRQSQKVQSHINKIANSPAALEIRNSILRELEQAWLTSEIYLNPKGLWSYYDMANNVLVKEVDTPMEIIVSGSDLQSCYRSLGVVNQIFPPIPRTIRDFIANPKPTGYQSLHARANIKGSNYLFKFRTEEMYQVGRTGIVRMWNEHRQVPTDFEREIQEMFGILGEEDDLSYRDIIAASGKKEIYTFTPKGDRVCLPKHSTVLDFAFKVHTEVGLRCAGGTVGSNRVGPEYILHDGDRVKILTKKTPQQFSTEMQSRCQSPKARSELARTFRYRRQLMSQQIGQSLVLQEMKRYGMPVELLEADGVEEILEHFEVENLNALYQEIGDGIRNLREVMWQIKESLYQGHEVLQPPTGALNRYFLDSLDPVCIKFSHCCDPNPTEKALMGLLSERGLSVHKKDCPKFATLTLQREDVVELRWRLKETRVEKTQTILVLQTSNRGRLLMMLGAAPNQMQIQEIVALSSLPDGRTAWEIVFKVETLRDLKDTLAHFTKTGLNYEFVLEQ